MDLTAVTGETQDSELEKGVAEFGVQRARRLVEHFARVTTSMDLDTFCAGFTEDCVIHYPPSIVVTGREELRKKMEGSFSANRPGFVCEKQLRSISGNVFGVIWISRWTDAETGKVQARKGVEFWTMRGEQIARWDAVSAIFDAA